jgi:hypothetical protein
MNRRVTDRISNRDILINKVQAFTYEELSSFSVDALQSIILGLFGRRSPEYLKTLEIKGAHSLAHIICDECNINYPDKYCVDNTLKFLDEKLNKRGLHAN